MTDGAFNFPAMNPIPDEAFGLDDGEFIIAGPPSGIYYGDALIITKVHKALLALVRESEARVDRKLHDARFVFTRDPETIRQTRRDDCLQCLAGEDQALAFLRNNPDSDVVVGWLRWIPEGYEA